MRGCTVCTVGSRGSKSRREETEQQSGELALCYVEVQSKHSVYVALCGKCWQESAALSLGTGQSTIQLKRCKAPTPSPDF